MKKLSLICLLIGAAFGTASAQAVKPDFVRTPNGPNTIVDWNMKFKTLILPHYNKGNLPVYQGQDTIGGVFVSTDTTDNHLYIKMANGSYEALANLSDIGGQPDGVSTGLLTTISGSNAITTAGSWTIGGNPYSKGSTTTTALEAQDATLFREDVLYATTAGTILKAVGTPGPTYTEPSIPDNTLPIAIISIASTASGLGVTTAPPPTGTVNLKGNQRHISALKEWDGKQLYNGGMQFLTIPKDTAGGNGLVINNSGNVVLDTNHYWNITQTAAAIAAGGGGSGSFVTKNKVFGYNDIILGDTLHNSTIMELDVPDTTWNIQSGSTGFSSQITGSSAGTFMGYSYDNEVNSQSINMVGDSGIIVENDSGNGMIYHAAPTFINPLQIVDKDYVDGHASSSYPLATDTVASTSSYLYGFGDSFLNSPTHTSMLIDLAKASGFGVNNQGIGGQTADQITARFLADTSSWKYPLIIEIGRNNLPDTAQTTHDVERIRDTLIAHHNTKYVFLSVFNSAQSVEWSGTSTYNKIIALNARMAAIAGTGHYLDWRTYAVSIRRPSPTHQDTVDIGHDVSPAWLRLEGSVQDTLHLSSTGNQYMGNFLYANIGLLRQDTAKLITTQNAIDLFKNRYYAFGKGIIPFGGPSGLMGDSTHFNWNFTTQALNIETENTTNAVIDPALNLTAHNATAPVDGFGVNETFNIIGANGKQYQLGQLSAQRNGSDSTGSVSLKLNNAGTIINFMKATPTYVLFGGVSTATAPSGYFAIRNNLAGVGLSIENGTSSHALFGVDLSSNLTITDASTIFSSGILTGGNATIGGSVIPSTSGFNIGSTSAGWTTIFGNTVRSATSTPLTFQIGGTIVGRFAGATGDLLIAGTTENNYKLDVQAAGSAGYFNAGNFSVNATGIPTFALASKIAITEGTGGRVGQTTLVAGTSAVTITGLTSSSRAYVTRTVASGTSLTTGFTAVCTANTLTITADVAAGTINTADTSTYNYIVIN